MRGLYCTEYDIHDLKLTEQALAAREEQLRLFTDNIPEPVVYLDGDRRYAFVNEAFLPLTGLNRDEVIGKQLRGRDRRRGVRRSWRRSTSARSAARASPTSARSIDVERPHALDARRASCPIMRFDGTIKGLYIVGHDITDLKRGAGRAGRARIAAARDHGRRAGAGRLHRSATSAASTSTGTFLQYFGLTAEQVERRCACATSSATASTRARRRCCRARCEGEATAFDRLVPGAQGRAPLDDDPRRAGRRATTGEVHGAFVLMNDIHGLKQAQEALRASEAELRLIMDNVPARVAYIDREYRLRFLNRHNEEWLGEAATT